jgi:hypothetical protein
VHVHVTDGQRTPQLPLATVDRQHGTVPFPLGIQLPFATQHIGPLFAC